MSGSGYFMPLGLELVSLSQNGARDYNEDRLAHWRDGQYALCVLADGAGGHGGGDVAAQLVCEGVLDAFAQAPSLEAGFLHSLVVQANAAVVARQQEGGRLARMRATVVLAVLDLQAGRMRWAHCGDSRAYLFRGQAIVARTVDHSVVQQMVSGGLLDDEGARLHPQRNVLLSALGTGPDDLDITVSDAMRVLPGDALLLCSDGVWEPVGDSVLTATLASAASPAHWADTLSAAVAARHKPDQDNYSALLAWLSSGDDDVTRLM